MHRRAQTVTNSNRRISEEIIEGVGGPSQAEVIPRFGTSALWSRQIREVFLNSWWMLHYMSIFLAPSVKTFEKDIIGRLGVTDLTCLSGRVIKVHLRRAWRYEIFSDPIGIRERRPSSRVKRLQDQSLMAAGNGRMSSSGDVLFPDSVAGSESSDALLLHRNGRMSSSEDVLFPDSVAGSESSDALLLHRNGRMSSSEVVFFPDSVAGSESSDALLLHRNARTPSSTDSFFPSSTDSISQDLTGTNASISPTYSPYYVEGRSTPIADLEGLRSGLPTVTAWRSTSPWIEATDLSIGLAFVLEIVLLWIEDSRPFELVVLVVSWINCLTAWTIFLWGARCTRAKFALPRFVLPNGQPYGHPIDYVEKDTSLALVVFTTVSIISKFSGRNFSTSGLVLSGTILGAKLGIEYQKRRVD